jgi:hypothetical protein
MTTVGPFFPEQTDAVGDIIEVVLAGVLDQLVLDDLLEAGQSRMTSSTSTMPTRVTDLLGLLVGPEDVIAADTDIDHRQFDPGLLDLGGGQTSADDHLITKFLGGRGQLDGLVHPGNADVDIVVVPDHLQPDLGQFRIRANKQNVCHIPSNGGTGLNQRRDRFQPVLR